MTLKHRRSMLPKLPKWRVKSSQTENHKHIFDIWLLRLSYISQFGLFVITLGSLYFVVLPVYQKSILDEAIARKEIELKESEKLVEQSYIKLRKYSVNQFTFAAFTNCIIDYQDMELTKDESREHNNLYHDATNCLLESEMNSTNLKDLRTADRDIIAKELKSVASEIEQHRIVALKKYIELPSKAKLDHSLLRPPKYFSRHLNESFEKLYKDLNIYSEEKMAKSRFDAEVASAQLDIYADHLDFAKQKLQSMIK